MSGSALYSGSVMHQRQDAHAYRFVYRVFSLLVDVDELPAVGCRLRFFSHNRFNLFSLYDRDHAGRDGTPLRAWAERELRVRGVDLQGGRIRLLCFPRVLGYVFNPLSVWYCEHRDGSLRAVICEVRNTFGGMHHYVLTRGGGEPMDWRAEYRAAKVFHVSPFIQQDVEYRFRFHQPRDRLGVHIGARSDGIEMFQANISGASVPLTDAGLLGVFWRLPLMPIKVIAAIHWQALKLWLRGARFHRMPEHGINTERAARQR